MRRGLAAAAMAVALTLTAACGNGDDDGPDSGSTPGTEAANGSNGDTRPGGSHPSVPEAMTTEEFCTDFEQTVIDPMSAQMGQAIDVLEAAIEDGDQAQIDDALEQVRAQANEYAQVFRAGGEALTDNPEFSAAIARFATEVENFGNAIADSTDWQPGGDVPDEVYQAGETLGRAGEDVAPYCD